MPNYLISLTCDKNSREWSRYSQTDHLHWNFSEVFILIVADGISDHLAALAPVVDLCIMFAAWLNLYVGVSRQNSSTFLKALQLILSTTIDVIFGVLRSSGIQIETPVLRIPRDIRTVYKEHNMEPDIIQTPCCPKCYTIYPSGELPITCTWRRSRRAAVCDAKLWKQRRTRKGELKDVPETVYSTQSFESWLHYFLGRSEIEDLLEQDYQQNIQRQHTASSHWMRDIQDSPAWRGLGGFVLSRYHLVWSIYIDWFNPYTNKIAGMSISMYYMLRLVAHLSNRKNCILWGDHFILP